MEEKTDAGKATKVIEWESVTAIDNHNDPLNVDCDPPSGSEFPLGYTSVVCETEEDDKGNQKNCTFDVHVIGKHW